MVAKTSELFPDPETPVKTVSRRFGISTLTSLRLFTRAPCTRIRSWLSASYDAGVRFAVFAVMLRSLSVVQSVFCVQRRCRSDQPRALAHERTARDLVHL